VVFEIQTQLELPRDYIIQCLQPIMSELVKLPLKYSDLTVWQAARF